MRFELQRADFWKRISAFLFDAIMLVIIAVGVATLLSAVLKYDTYSDEYSSVQQEYYDKYGVDPDIPVEEQKEVYDAAQAEFIRDERAIYNYTMLFNLTLIILSFSLLIAYVVWEIVIPRFLGHGRTLGKKIFGLAVMRTNGVKVGGIVFFVRTVIGKYTIETMVPLYFIIMALFGSVGIMGIIMVVLLGILEIFTIATTKTRSTIHDLVSDTVVVDMASQMIFDSEEELIAYKTRIHEEEVRNKEY